MAETDLQLGGGYMYQWECAILLELNNVLDSALNYNPEILLLLEQFLGQVVAVHLEGKEANEVGNDREDVNLLGTGRVVCIQVEA